MCSAAYELGAVRLEIRPLRPFKSSEEYLWAMKEDLAEWMNTLYGLKLTPETFLESLDDGVTLCRHANKVLEAARREGRLAALKLPDRDVVYRPDVQRGTFQARDNVSNFIAFCRALDIKECLLFETEDLVMRKNERSFILCLLEVARRGARLGMLAPLLVQFEQEIDAELEHECDSDEEPPPPRPQIITNDLRSLHERVVDLLNRCTCPSQFPMIRVADGKYRIGDTKVLIFVRILRSHVMVRVGGGWDTLEHYLDKHDPCRCRSGHRTSTSAKLTMTAGKGGSPTMQVTYNRPPAPSYSYGSTSPLMSHRGLPHNNSLTGDHDRDLTPSRISHCSDDSTSSSSGGCGVPADSSSETSEGEFAKTPGGSRKCSPRKIAKTGNVTPQPGEFGSTNGSSPWKMTPPERPDSAGGRSHDVVDSGAASADESYASSASPSASPAKTNGTTSSPRHSISGVGSRQTPPPPSAKSRIPYLAAPHRATSSENLTTNGTTSPTPQHHQQQQMTKQQATTNGRVRQSSTPPNPNARRRSVDAGLATLPRSRSHSSEGSMTADKAFLTRGVPGRCSWRSPPPVRTSPRSSSDGNKTWAFRQRGSSRPALTPDLFTEPGSKRSAVHSSPTKSQRPNVISPLLQELLREKDLDSDDKILKKMEFIVNHYRSRLDKGDCGEANGSSTLPKASHTAPTSPDSFCSPPCRRRGSKIPMATYYDRD
uniref:Microtubule n=1 Tax=Rhipicephalus zambeziensis TaxID=60191 RepID=A0A224YTJ5_9ACAR